MSVVHETLLLVVRRSALCIITLQVFDDILFTAFLRVALQIAFILYNLVENHLYAS